MTCHPQMPPHPVQEITGLVKDSRAEESLSLSVLHNSPIFQPRPLSWKTWGHLEGGMVIPLKFYKAPQSSLGLLKVPQVLPACQATPGESPEPSPEDTLEAVTEQLDSVGTLSSVALIGVALLLAGCSVLSSWRAAVLQNFFEHQKGFYWKKNRPRFFWKVFFLSWLR